MSSCSHPTLQLDSSTHADEIHFKRATEQQRLAATRNLTKKTVPVQSFDGLGSSRVSPQAFPGPLVLPDDDLAGDPKYPPQSVLSWTKLKERNHVTPKRRTIYVAAPPTCASGLKHVQAWTRAKCSGSKTTATKRQRRENVNIQDLMEYVSAFYHGLPVKLFPHALKFVPWDDSESRNHQSRRELYQDADIAISTGKELIKIRHRLCFDESYDRQLNLNDLLDVAIETLPDDAYAVMMIVDHDIYEDEEDEFCCGRAYGGSRVAVVSTARYNPILDELQNIDMLHAWPASHCAEFVAQNCATNTLDKPRSKQAKMITDPTSRTVSASGPIRAAIAAYSHQMDRYALFLSRVARTASHELGHCFGIDHCVYYACAMQGTASAAEDARQPPYLCPVDLTKVLISTGSTAIERYESMRKLCVKWAGLEGSGGIWASHAMWIEGVQRLGVPPTEGPEGPEVIPLDD